LYIPDNIKTGYEFVSGFGWGEFAKTAVIIGISLIVALIWNGISDSTNGFIRSFLIVALSGGAAIGFFRKDDTNQSMLDHMKRIFRFSKEQQKFKYCYYNPFGLGVNSKDVTS